MILRCLNRAVLLLSSLCFFSVRVSAAPSSANFDKVAIVVLENTTFSRAAKNSIFKGLMNQGATLTNYFAVTNPSQPNYVAMIAGSNLGVRDDKNVDLNEEHLGDLIERHGRTWKTYAEDYPGNCFLGNKAGRYVRKHVPFLSFKNVQVNPSRCDKIQSDKMFYQDFKMELLPDYSLIVPNLDSDGHDTGVDFAASWFAKNISPLMAQPYGKTITWIITFDEGNILNNQVLTILVGPNIQAGATSNKKLNHYSLLRTIEDVWQLGTLQRNDANAAPIEGIWK